MIELKDNKQLNQYIAEFEEDTKLSVYNIREKALTVSAVRAKWLNYFFVEKENLERATNAKNQYVKKTLSTSKNNDSVLRLKNEENVLANDETLNKIKKIISLSQANIDYLQMVLNILDGFGYQIKTISEILKLEKT